MNFFANKFNKRRLCFEYLLLCLISVFFCISAQAKVSIYKQGKEKRFHILQPFFNEIDKTSSNLIFRSAPKGPVIKVFLTDLKKKEVSVENRKNEICIYVPEEFAPENFTNTDLVKIVGCVLKEKLKILCNSRKDLQAPNWLVAGISYKIKENYFNRKLPLTNLYFAAWSAVVSGKVPSLESVLSSNLNAEFENIYEVNSQFSYLLLDFIMKTGDGEKTLRDALNLEYGGVSSYNSLLASLEKAIGTNNFSFSFCDRDFMQKEETPARIERWFAYMLSRKSVNIFNPAPPEFTIEKLAMTRELVYHLKTDNAKEAKDVSSCQISELPEKESEIDDIIYLASRQEKYLAEILYFSNSELHSELRKIMGTYSLIKRGKIKEFVSEYEKANRDFLEKARKISSIEKLIAETEKKNINPGKRLKHYLDLLDKTKLFLDYDYGIFEKIIE